MFDTVVSVENGGDCCFKTSSNMKYDLFLIFMWYARRSSGREAALFQQYCISYTWLLLLFIYPQLFIILGGDKKQIALLISFHRFLWTFFVELVPRFFKILVLLLHFVFLRSSDIPTLLYNVPMMPFSLASFTSGHTFPLELNPSSILSLKSAREYSQFQSGS